MILLTIIPAEAWKAPINDQVYRGFDANLIYKAGAVQITRDVIDARTTANAPATVNLVTSQRDKLAFSLDVNVLSNDGAVRPLRIGAWSPWTGTGFFIAFGSAPTNEITADTVSAGTAGPTLIGGNIDSTPISHYQLGQNYRLRLVIDRAAGTVRADVTDGAVVSSASLTRRQSPELFGSVPYSVTASSEAGEGPSHFTLRNYSLTLPHERVWASKIDDRFVKNLVVGLASLGVLAVLAASVTRRRPLEVAVRPMWHKGVWWLAAGGAILYILGNAALFPLGGHPFDFGNEELYAYVARTYGVTHLYFVPGLSALVNNWNGIPWVESEFPYSPVIAYVFWVTGWLGSGLFGGGALSTLSAPLGYVIKSVNVAFGLIDGALILLILRQLKTGERWSRIGAALFVFNPAVWFSASIWGQTHVISICLILLTILATQQRKPFWAWLALIAACLTRPQMVLFGALLGVVFLKRFTWSENAFGMSWAVVVTFVYLLPLTLLLSPSLPVDIMVHNVLVQGGSGGQAAQATVSESAYSIWPLVTYAVHGASGMNRAYTPSSTLLISSISYQTASEFLTVAVFCVVVVALIARKRAAIDHGGYIPIVAVGITSSLMLLTGVVATHFLLALPILLLCKRWLDGIAYVTVAAIWSVSTLVPMYGDMGTVISTAGYPLLAAANNPVTRFFVELYSWDRFITVAIVANLCAIVWVAVLAYRPTQFRSVTTATSA